LNIHEKFFTKIGANYLIYGLAALIFQIILVNLIIYVNADLLSDYNMTVIVIAFCNYVLPLPVIMFLMKKLDTTPIEERKLPVRTFLKYVCITLTLMWIGNIIGLAATSAIGVFIQSNVSNPVQDLINTADIWLNLVLVSVIGPIFEEFVFRKLLIDRSIKYGARVSIILSAVLFAFFHGNLNQFFYAFLMGGFFAYVYIKTGKIIYPIILHIIVNLMGSVISLMVAESVSALTQGTYTSFDLAFIILYLALLLIVFLVGIISLVNYEKSKFNGSKTEISLIQPVKTLLINPGMICFMGFFVFEIVYQLLG
jgi:membrane protease YdiL (CAAX protease family)